MLRLLGDTNLGSLPWMASPQRTCRGLKYAILLGDEIDSSNFAG